MSIWIQLITGDESQHHSGNGRITDSEMLRIIEKTAGDKVCRCGSHIACCDLSNLLVDRIEHPLKISHDTADDHALEPICDLFKDTLHEPPPSLREHAEELRHPGQRSINSCEKRDSADAVVVRNARCLSSCNSSGPISWCDSKLRFCAIPPACAPAGERRK